MLFAQVHRRFDLHLDIHVAFGLAAQDAHALALQAELVAVLRAFGDGDLHASAIDGGDLDMPTERGGGEGQWHGAEDIRPVAFENFVRFDGDENIEITGRAAAEAGLAFARQTDAGAFLDP